MSRFGEEWDKFLDGESATAHKEQGASSQANESGSSKQSNKGFMARRLLSLKKSSSKHNSRGAESRPTSGEESSVRYIFAPDVTTAVQPQDVSRQMGNSVQGGSSIPSGSEDSHQKNSSGLFSSDRSSSPLKEKKKRGLFALFGRSKNFPSTESDSVSENTTANPAGGMDDSLETYGIDPRSTDDDFYMPSMAEVESELQVIAYRKRYLQLLRNTLAVLLVAAAAAALVATIWMPVLQIYGKSMYPTLEEGEIVVSLKSPELKTGDPVAFYYNNKLLIKRVIASPGQFVNIDSQGNVYVDNQLIDEPYLNEKSFEPCDIEFPYQVPDQRWFVLGDNRSVSVDSRDSSIGCIPKEYIVGRVEFCVWPLNKFGWIS